MKKSLFYCYRTKRAIIILYGRVLSPLLQTTLRARYDLILQYNIVRRVRCKRNNKNSNYNNNNNIQTVNDILKDLFE